MSAEPQLSAVLLAAVLAALALAAAFAFHLRRPPKLLDRPRPPADRRQEALDRLDSFRSRLLSVFRLLAIVLVGAMAVLTIVFFFSASPNDGSRLMAIVLGVLTVLLALHLQKLHRRFHRTGTDIAEASALRSGFRAELERKIGAALLDRAKVEWMIAPTEVHRLDGPALDKARAMAAEGRPIAEICRAAEPAYDGWNEAHRRAFENLLKAAIAHQG